MTGSYPWKITDGFSTIVYVTNITDQDAQFITQINYPSGTLVFKPRKVGPGETAIFDLKRIRDEAVNDLAGNRLPANASQGQFRWAVRGVTNGKLALIGRAEMVSDANQISSSYSCNDPCPPFYSGDLNPFPPPIVVNGSGSTAVWETAHTDEGYIVAGPYATSAEWSLADGTATATIDPAWGHSTVATGVAPAITNLHGFIAMQQDYGWDGLNCYEYGQYEEAVDAPVDVNCTFPQSETTASSGWSTLDPTVHRWNQTLTGGTNFSGRSVTEQVGTASDTCHFPNSAFPPATLQGSTWPVNSSNQWGDDFVGWYPGVVNYYRAQGRAPCSANIQQLMFIDCPRGPIHYITNTIGGDINLTTVTSRRAGSTAIRSWP